MLKRSSKYFTALLIALMAVTSASFAQIQVPDRPSPPRLVNDFTGTLTAREKNTLEQKLVRFNDTSSTQITIVLVSDFNGRDKAQFAYKIGQQWGVGQEEFDNGIVILVKPKEKADNNKGEVFIATGYGVEGAVPDAIANRITDEEMIPQFKKGNYFVGLDKGTNVLIDLTSGEYTAQEYQKQSGSDNKTAGYLVPLLALGIAILLMKNSQRSKKTFGKSRTGTSPGLLTALFLIGFGGRHGGSWNNFSAGGGSFGGDAGFGGFGGGDFGGGGAGGSW